MEIPSVRAGEEAAQALVSVIGESRWWVVALAHGYLALQRGETETQAARVIYGRGDSTLTSAREAVAAMAKSGFLSQLPARQRTGSAQNPVTKLFPATITEQRFLELGDEVTAARKQVTFSDEREVRHGLADFTLTEGDAELPINIKNAGTAFMRAKQLVGLEPEDCIPIPAYKANAAVARHPNLVYVVSADYDLIGKLNQLLPTLLSGEEAIVWQMLNDFGGSHLKNAEDKFIFATVRKYWDRIRPIAAANPFHVISARKALRVLQTKPSRTPGIGLKAWGTGASAEVNVHVSIEQDMTMWTLVRDRIIANGLADIVKAVNRRRVEEVYDPEI
jgi:hypothetical protein